MSGSFDTGASVTPEHFQARLLHCAEYSVLLRTFNSEATLPRTLSSLEQQTRRPKAYLIVDSGSTDSTLKLLPQNSMLHHFVGEEFNYSAALNQGLEYITTDYVLIISSHTSLENRTAVEHAIALLDSDERIGAASFCGDKEGVLRHEVIDKSNFDGFNGLSNTCSMIRMSLLRKRAFRPEVFTAEDQEWARWWIIQEHGSIARFSGAGWEYANPRGFPLRKRMNEYVSVAYFTNRRLLGWRNIAGVAIEALTPGLRLRPRERLYRLWLAARLIRCHFAKPAAASRYF